MSFLSLSRSIFSLTSTARAFSTTNVNLAGYKLKTHTGTKKRWSAIANGMFKRVSELLRPLTENKPIELPYSGKVWKATLEHSYVCGKD